MEKIMACKNALGWAVPAALAMCLAGCSQGEGGDSNDLLLDQVQQLTDRVLEYRAEVRRSHEELSQLVSGTHVADSALHARLTSHALPAGNAGGDSAGEAFAQAHETMNHAMASQPLTGDVDRDFLIQMIPHHEGAIEMAEIVLQSGQRDDVRQFAQSIIAHQQAEIDLMRYWLDNPATAPKPTPQ
jgi:uncharacterized protein (DUF305 family)